MSTTYVKSSFCTFVKNTNLVRIPPPSCHMVCRLTGGLATLYKQAKPLHQQSNNTSKVEFENVSCTDENGIFNADLFKEVPLLAKRYKYVKVLGRGISSILIQAVDTHRRDDYQVAIKILHTEYQLLGYQEADTVLRLNRIDPSNFSRVVKLLNTFQFGDHFCMVYELLHPNPLYEVISKNLHQDKKLKLIRKIAVQLLQVLGFLSQANVIHADLKPENILCCSDDISEGVKVVDFGNAIRCIFNELSLYYDDFQLQTILYRAPEVVFGLPFGPEIDMWSVGCILAELYIGEPLFPAKSSDFLLTRMIGLLGPLPASPFNRGKFHNDFIGYIGEKQPPHVTVNKIKHRLNGSPDFTFVTFLYGMLKYNPDERMTVSEAFQHAFIAPEVAGRFLLHGLKNPYSTLDIDSSLYTKSPDVSADIAKECLTKVELLRRGTFRRAVAEVSPFISKKKSPRVNVHPQTVHTTQQERAVNRNDVAVSRDMDYDTTQQKREMDRGVVDVAGRRVDRQHDTTQQERAATRNDVAGRRVDTQHDTTQQERAANRNDVAGRKVDTPHDTAQKERAMDTCVVPERRVNACPQKPQTAPQASCAKHSRSLPSLNKKGRTRKPFEYFDKSRKNGLKNCLDGFKELENCDDLNSIYGNVNDPYDIDNIFNDVITPVKLLGEKQSQQKQNIKLKTMQCRKSLKINDDNKEVAIPRKSPYSEKKRIEPELDLKNIGNKKEIAKSSLTTVNRKRKTLDNSEIQFSDNLTTFTTENTLKIKKRQKLNDEEQTICSPEVQRSSSRKNKGEKILNSKLKHRNDMDDSKKSHQELEKHSTKKQSKTVNKNDKHKKEIKSKNQSTLNTENCIDKDSSTSKTLKVKISNVSTVNSNVKQDSVEHFLQCKDSEKDWFHVDGVKKRRRKEETYFYSQVEDDILLL